MYYDPKKFDVKAGEEYYFHVEFLRSSDETQQYYPHYILRGIRLGVRGGFGEYVKRAVGSGKPSEE